MGFGRVTMDFFSASLWMLLLCSVFLVSSYELPKAPEFQFVTARTENIFQEKVNNEGETSSGKSITEDGASSRSFLINDFPNHGSPDFERGPNPPGNLQNLDSNPNFNKYLNLDRIQNNPNFDRGLNSGFSEGHPKFSGRDPNFERSGSLQKNSNFERSGSPHRNPNFGRPSSSSSFRSPNFEGPTFERNQNFDGQPDFLHSDRNGNSPNFDGSSNSQNFNGNPNFNKAPNSQNFQPSRNSGRNPQKPDFNRDFSPSNWNRGSNFERNSNFDDRPNSGRNPNFDQMVESTQNQYSNLYRHPKAKVNRQLKFEPNDDDRDFKGHSNDIDENPDWSSGGGKNPKTFPMPNLPTLDIIEDPGYDHNRPKWPLNEYLTDKFNSFYRPNFFGGSRSNQTHEATKQYEWQQLKPLSNSYSSGSDSFDRNKYFNLDDDESFRNRHRHGHANALQGYRYADGTRDQHPPLNNGHSTTVSTMTDVKGSASENSERGKYGFSSAYGQPHYFPPDHYPKKRFRLSIHPGYIAAPLAGIAAFGAASALTKKPLLFELGLVNNKHHYAQNYPHQGGVHYPGHGWASTVMPVVPGHGHIGAPIINSGNPSPNPTFPVLKPEASQVLHGHHLHHHHHHSYPNRQHGHHHGHHPHHHNHGHHHN
ncbi:unnamed protein product, partial [Allacma fusca]